MAGSSQMDSISLLAWPGAPKREGQTILSCCRKLQRLVSLSLSTLALLLCNACPCMPAPQTALSRHGPNANSAPRTAQRSSKVALQTQIWPLAGDIDVPPARPQISKQDQLDVIVLRIHSAKAFILLLIVFSRSPICLQSFCCCCV